MKKLLLTILVLGSCACTPAIDQSSVAGALDTIGAMLESNLNRDTSQGSTTNCHSELDSAIATYFKMSASLVYTIHIYRDSIRSHLDMHVTPISSALYLGPESKDLLCSLDTTITSEENLSSRTVEINAIGEVEYDIDRIKVVGWRHDGTIKQVKIFIPADEQHRQPPLRRLVAAIESSLALHQASTVQE